MGRIKRKAQSSPAVSHSNLKRNALTGCAAIGLMMMVGVYAAVASDFRIWKNSNGHASKTRMSVVDHDGSTVRFKREDDGRELELPISRLSAQDRDYLRELEADSVPNPFRQAKRAPMIAPSPTVTPSSAITTSLSRSAPSSRRSSSPSRGNDFAQWRGANRDGVVIGGPQLASSWSGSGPRQVWTSGPIPSGWKGGWGCVAVADGRAYAYANICPSQGAPGPIAQDVVYCLSAETGETIWRYQHDGGRHNTPSNSTPTVVDGHCYVHGSGGMFYCLDARTGDEHWVAEASRPASNETSSSFAVADHVAVVMSTQLTGIDAQTGEVLWTESSAKSRHSSPSIWRSHSKTYAVCHTDRALMGVDIATGDVAWRTRGGGGDSSPVVVGDIAVQRTRDVLVAYDLTDHDATERWTVRFGDEGSSPIVYDGHVYAVKSGGETICVRLSDGQEQWRSDTHRTRFASPIVADGKLFIVLDDDLYMLAASSSGKQILDHAQLRVETCTSPAIADGKIFLRKSNEIACYDLR